MTNLRSPYQRELRRRLADAEARRNQIERDGVARVAGSIGGTVVTTEDAVTEALLRDNTLSLLSGTHGGFVVSTANATITGVAGTIINREVVVDTTDDTTTFKKIHFQCLDPNSDNAGGLVVVKAGSTAIFEGCVFELEGVTMVQMVEVEATGKAHFSGCSFLGAQTAGSPVNNAGNQANCSINASTNKTTRTHTNVVVISQTS